jgi:hypothetical protein
VKYAAIADWAIDKEYSVALICAQLGVARQGYYRWLATGPCKREASYLTHNTSAVPRGRRGARPAS